MTPYPLIDGIDLHDVLHRAEESLNAAISALHADREAALDDLLAARLLIATAAVSLTQGVSLSAS